MKSNATTTLLGRMTHFLFSLFMIITLSSCGGGGGSPGKTSGGGGGTSTGSGVGSVSLLFSSSELKSAGTPGSEVTVTVLVKGGNNNALAAIPVTISSDSGVLTVADTATNQNGQATATLGTSGDRTNRKITVTATAGGVVATGSIDVIGTSVSIVGPSTISANGTGDFTVTVKDSSNNVVPGVPVVYSSQKGNPISVKSSGGGTTSAPLTNSQGQVVLAITAAQSGNDVISVTSQGANTSAAVNVNASKLAVAVVDGSGNAIASANTTTSCPRVVATYEISGAPQSGSVNISTSRGKLYSDSSCSSPLGTSTVPLVNGNSQSIYLKSDTAGVATVTAVVPSGPTAQASVEFIAALTALATIDLQVDPAVIGTNSGTGQSEKAIVTAVVRDGTTHNNFVKGATVEFTLDTDQSGGSLSNPTVVTTQSNGAASVTFIAGTAATSKDGVVIKAQILGTSKTKTASLTVSKKSLFLSAGTGNKLETPSETTYQQNYTVFVTDASGNPVSGATVTATVIPTRYRKGYWSIDDDDGDPTTPKVWMQTVNDTCLNEDQNQDGVLDAGEDVNNNGALEPGIPLHIDASGTTDATGTAVIPLLYPRNQARWLEVKLTFRGSVAGTESIFQPPPYVLPILSEDLDDLKVSPPGSTSPYGVNSCNLAN